MAARTRTWIVNAVNADDKKWAHTGLHDVRASRSSQIYCGVGCCCRTRVVESYMEEEAVTAALMLERAAASPNLPTATEAHYVGHAEVGTSRRAGGRRRAQCVIRRGGTMRNGRDRDALKAFADKSARDYESLFIKIRS
ncbi:hypothetical protein C8J57DRAFT_1248500 [Mycena rebaudengoi]|nr:hypothetical protein C8J57DRAFT_1248500 [Mycena rebaudengoi]